MLMLVVTIIIAAVVSAYSGGLATGTKKVPSANVEIHISNGGVITSTFFQMKVAGVSEPIPTKDLKIVSTWTAIDGTKNSSTVVPGKTNVDNYGGDTAGNHNLYVAPLGYGNGVTQWTNSRTFFPEQHWGNFTLTTGTLTMNYPSGYGTPQKYAYNTSAEQYPGYDGMEGILGMNWEHLRPGDKVNVKIIHVPSGKVIADKEVIVEG
jgi:FlaG/FlaF family flagellin (archaellin)